MNTEEDLDALHKHVCEKYRKHRERGGRADSPYAPFFLEVSGAVRVARRFGERVRPEYPVVRKDGTVAVVDLEKVFVKLGFCEPGYLWT
jgi:hypothetical protein